MTGTLLFLATGLLLMVLVVFLLQRPKISTGEASGTFRNDESLDSLQTQHFWQQLAARIFGSQDWDYVVKQGSPRLQGLFLQQRKALALSWLRTTRASATRLIRVHRATVRSSSRLEPLVELQIAVDYLLFVVLCHCLVLAIMLRGPVDLNRLITYVDGLSDRLSSSILRILPLELAAENNTRGPYLTNT